MLAGSIDVVNSTFSGNSATDAGGGIANNGGTLTVTNSTFSGNSATNGGGILTQTAGGTCGSASAVTISNSTFVGNSATNGGGIYNWLGGITLLSNTITANTSGGGVRSFNHSVTCTKVVNNIIAGNTGYDVSADETAQRFSSLDYNLIGVAGSGVDFAQEFNQANDQVNVAEPMLGTLMNNGGSTQSVALLPGSPAIDAGDDTACAAAPINNKDQRGVTRPQGSHCDIGAYEYDYSGVYYVKQATSGTGDCQSWDNACELQTALQTVLSGNEVWVAAGTYKPTAGTDRTISFELKNGVAIYGGFAGTETLRTQRNFETNVTTLSGDIGTGDDNSDNSYHVVVGSGTDNSTLIDGFTVTAGNADADISTPDTSRGGGMFNDLGNPTVQNMVFSGNYAVFGGGIHNGEGSISYPLVGGSSPVITNVIFANNSAYEGGGMENYGYSNPILTNVIFRDNSAERTGGGMDNLDYSNPSLTNVTFSDNTAAGGGGMSNTRSDPTLINVTFADNTAELGGGLGNYSSSPTLTNVTFTNNVAIGADPPLTVAPDSGGGIYNENNSNPVVRNTILWGNTALNGAQVYDATSTPVVSDSVVQDGYASGTNVITADPKLGTLGDYGGFTETIPLQAGSSAIDAGDDATCASTDQRGVARPQGGHCDIGAYETIVHYVKWNATGADNGSSWTDAYTDLQSALSAASSGDEIWVAAGTYKPTTGTDRTISFELKNGVAIYGGFAGTETFRTQRDPAANVTVLSGDIGVADDNSDNSYHVVVGSNTNNSAILDGFTVSAGNANDSNTTNASGGGMYNNTGSPTLMNVTFNGNSAGLGGGMVNTSSSPTLTNVTFSGNSAEIGGGMGNQFSSPNLLNVTFNGNVATEAGGGMVNRGLDNPVLTNVTFSNNSAPAGGGGGISNNGNPIIRNSILWGNTGGEIFNLGGTPVVTNSIVQGGYTGTGNLDVNPLLGPLQDNGGFTQTMALGAGSPAIDAGDDGVCPTTDQRGVTRPQGGHCDIGAYEYKPSASPDVDVTIGGTSAGGSTLGSGGYASSSYLGIAAGPVRVTNANNTSIVASQRVIHYFGGANDSYYEMMGLPFDQLSTEYWYPYYTNVNVNTQLRFSNVDDTNDAIVQVYVAGNPIGDPITVAPNTIGAANFYSTIGGPVQVKSTNGVKIISTERFIFTSNGVTPVSFSETMGMPLEKLRDEYWFPFYNNVSLNSQLRFANVGTTDATVEVHVAGAQVGPTYTVSPNTAQLISLAGVAAGPVQIISTNHVPIVASQRVIHYFGGTNDSYYEMMGLPFDQLSTEYWYPYYTNVNVNTQLRFSNVDDTNDAIVQVYVAGNPIGDPITVAPNTIGAANFYSTIGGPVQVKSTNGVKIISTERFIFTSNGVTPVSFSETMGMPLEQMRNEYWFPFYNNVSLNSQMRFALP